jgi:hypothetical protein
MLIEVLHRRKDQRTPELHAAQLLPMLIDPAQAFLEKAGDLLRGHYLLYAAYVNLWPIQFTAHPMV